jgi:endoglucanase
MQIHLPVRRPSVCRASLIIIFLLLLTVPAAFAQGTGYWHTTGNQILDSNNQTVRIAGINWYGFETTDEVIHGLWAQDYHTILNEIKSNGFNVIRVPFSNQMVENPVVPTNLSFNNGTAINTDLQGLNSLQVLDKIVTAAGAIGLRVILDNHRSEAGNSNEANGLWYTSAFPETAWINDWKTLATRYATFTDASGNPTVIGMDLRNEPHLSANGANTGACWTGDTSTSGCPATNTAQNWPAAATRAGNAILAINPSLLIFVEGNDCYNGDCGWQGGNLEGVQTNPVVLSVASRVVYSPHDYGPAVFQQSWFNGSTTFASLSSIWTKFWAYISVNDIAPVWLGEFGTGNNATDIQSATAGSEGQWFQSLVAFIQNTPNLSWMYWALNGEDSFALLNSQYNGVANSTKLSLLTPIEFPLGGGGGTPNFSLAASPTSLTVNRSSSGTSTITITRVSGFAGAVSFTASGLPTGVTASFNPAATTTTGTSTVLTLTASATATTGNATVTVTGTSGTLTHTATIALTVAVAATPRTSHWRQVPPV